LDILFAAVYLKPRGGSRLVFAADSDNPLQVHHDAALGQQEVCRLQLHLSESEKCPLYHIRQIGRLADHLDAFTTIKSPGMRRQQSLRPATKTSLG
jgi:hypothetical protein